MSTVAITRRPL